MAQTTGLQLHYNFQTLLPNLQIEDQTGNGRHASLSGSAVVRPLGQFGVVETGSTVGFVEMSSRVGEIIATLNQFTIACYVYIDPVQNISGHGNFIWSFANSRNIAVDANGCMFFSTRESRYAISRTHWQNEQQVSLATAFSKGAWHHVAYVQSGTTGQVFINGVLQRSSTVNLLPSTLGATAHNFLFRSPYANDAHLLNSKITDFRIYNVALSASDVSQLAQWRTTLDNLLFAEHVSEALAHLYIENSNDVRTNVLLPSTGIHQTSIAWSSSHPSVISSAGVVTRPSVGGAAIPVVLTATVTKQNVLNQRQFTVMVQPQFSDQESVAADAASLTLSGNLHLLRSNLILPTAGSEGSTIHWTSLQPAFLSHQGVIQQRPAKGSGNLALTLKAEIRKNQAVAMKDFQVILAEDEGYAGYLFAYFTGNNIAQEAIRFAISTDGLNYRALNHNQPIIASSAISRTGGVRDPHILRGNDGFFYMVVTDMVSANGWSSNRGMVLLRSTDLIHWTSSTVHIPTAFPQQFGNVDRVWAPQTIFDPEVGKFMVYFSMRRGNSDYDRIYYAYANSDFTALETVPQQLFFHPSQVACIDGDIVWHEGEYHLFFKTEGAGQGIKKAVSQSLTGNWVMYDTFLQQTTAAVEGSCVFRLINSDTWIMMYDVYIAGFYQFTQSNDLKQFSVISSGVSMDFAPRHGTVLPITASEMEAIRRRWDPTVGHAATTQTANPRISVNPSNHTVTVEPTEKGKLRIYHLTGKLLFTREVSELHPVTFNLPANGMYLMQFTNSQNHSEVARFVL